jgi:hypothetical protein
VGFWRDLLTAADEEDGERLDELHLHAKLRLFGGLLHREE